MIKQASCSVALLLSVAASGCSSDDGQQRADGAVAADAAADVLAPDTAASDAAEPEGDAAVDGAPADLPPDLPSHPLVGTWSGNPVDCFSRTKKSPAIRMTFSPTEVSFYQFFMSGTNVCEHRGKGQVTNLTESSFMLVGYKTTSTNCNLGMFLQGDQQVDFEFLDDAQDSVFIDPEKEECFLLTRQ